MDHNDIGILIAHIVAFAQTDPLSGGAGWVGAGLLGAVLTWLLFVHLPAKDKQVATLMEVKDNQISGILAAQAEDRDRDRQARHERANVFQLALNNMAKDYSSQMRDMHDQHTRDADKDRQAFLQRSEIVKIAIEKQTLELERAIKASCQFVATIPARVRGEKGCAEN